ncbi:MAG: DUF962 domain-containing protein [Pseudoxanthomonas suwonensis]|nr:DUF962 domain-containing protein [Pseudoxanthomonas suwonensis]
MATPEPVRPIDRWFDSYSSDHRHPVNQWIHVVCVPLILWSVIALLWCIPVPEGGLFRDGMWALFAMLAAWVFYRRNSRPIALGMAVTFLLMALLTRLVHDMLGPQVLLYSAIVVFVLAWIGQFVGHKIEGAKPSFLTDITYLLIGPAWVLAKLYRQMGWRW